MNKREKMEQLLENTRRALENSVDQSQPDLKIMMPVIRNIMPDVIARDILGVQPMTRQSMTVGEMDHACSTWYWARPPYDPGGIFDYARTEQRVQDIEHWIEDTCGPRGSWHEPECRWWASNGKYIFKNEEDRTMFVLRWS